MDDYAGRVLADRYRLPLPPSDEYELVETRAFDTYSGQEVLVRQVPLPEVVEAEVLDDRGGAGVPPPRRAAGRTTRRPTDPAVRRAVEAAQAAAQIPDHPRLDQVFDVFAEDGSLWIVSELVAARPLAALLAERPLNPYRAAEIGSDVLTALRALHAHGWTHRNITVRTVLVCDDGRVVLTGLAAGAAEEALCGYAPVPEPAAGVEEAEPAEPPFGAPCPPYAPPYATGPAPLGPGGQEPPGPGTDATEAYRVRPSPERLPAPPALPDRVPGPGGAVDRYAPPAYGHGIGGGPDDARAARAGAIAAYRAGARAASRLSEESRQGPARDDRDQDRVGDGGPGACLPGDSRWALPGGGDPGSRSPRSGDGTGGGERSAAEYGAPFGADGDGPTADPEGRRWQAADDEGAHGAGEAVRFPGRAAAGPSPGGPDGTGRPPGGDDPTGAHGHGDRVGGGALPPAGRATDGIGRLHHPGVRDEWDAPEGSGTPPGTAVPPLRPRPALPAPRAGSPAPQWWSRPADAEAADDADEHDDPDGGPHDGPHEDPDGGPRRVRLAGIWRDGPTSDGAAPVPAGGSAAAYGGSARDALRADARRGTDADAGARPVPAGRWDEVVAAGATPEPYRGPTTPLAAERARQTRIAVVGAVTERWAPEQAGPVHENWQLAPPIGPATDLWALGALLYRAVQGHAPYPEEHPAELVQLVCAEPPAFAEECGPLRPVVESLLRQDATERPDFEELRGWLRSLVRSAPEPDAGTEVVPLPSVDGTRLPVVRRRGELVRRRRGGSAELRGRHRHKKPREPRPPREPRERPARSPRALGRTLLLLILLALAAAIAYAVLFMPRTGPGAAPSSQPASSSSQGPDRPGGPDGEAGGDPSPDGKGPQTSAPAVDLAEGYVVRVDPEGFRIGVDKTWQRNPVNDSGQVRYVGGDFTLIVVPGRDTVGANGSDPMAYQRDKERELQPFRDSSWSTASGLRRIDVGKQAMAEGQFTWQDSTGREVYVRNLAMIVGDRYHVLQVIGPEGQRDKVTEIYQQAMTAYRARS
ncbi:protein kinase [Streptomyces marianii]|uniref:Serine/threonine protein kinase n=1 Tax=Streptomyces marianii TaxID=1817406 RepID=A0A5R9E7J7_9ACTN|nr:protein kinase [Streptomyces marianii]TLQ44214.1 serine/threonine protein kinase [Streptomyces marianii]